MTVNICRRATHLVVFLCVVNAEVKNITTAWYRGWPGYHRMNTFWDTFNDGDWQPQAEIFIETTPDTVAQKCYHQCWQEHSGVVGLMFAEKSDALAYGDKCKPQLQDENGEPLLACFGENASTAPGPEDHDPVRFILAEFVDWSNPNTPKLHAYVPDSLAQVGQNGVFFATPMDSGVYGAPGPSADAVSNANTNQWKIIDEFWARPKFISNTCFDKVTDFATDNQEWAFGSGWKATRTLEVFDQDMLRCRSEDKIDVLVGFAGNREDGRIQVYTDFKSFPRGDFSHLASFQAQRKSGRRLRMEAGNPRRLAAQACVVACPETGPERHSLQLAGHSCTNGIEFCGDASMVDSSDMQYAVASRTDGSGNVVHTLLIDPDVTEGDRIERFNTTWVIETTFWAPGIGPDPVCSNSEEWSAILKRCKATNEIPFPVGYYAGTEYRTFYYPMEKFSWPNSGWEWLTGFVAKAEDSDPNHNVCYSLCLKKTPFWRMRVAKTQSDLAAWGCDAGLEKPKMCVAETKVDPTYKHWAVGTFSMESGTDFDFIWMDDDETMKTGDIVSDPPALVPNPEIPESLEDTNHFKIMYTFWAKPMPGRDGPYITCWGGYEMGDDGKCQSCPLGTYRGIGPPYDASKCSACPNRSTTEVTHGLTAARCICDGGYEMLSEASSIGDLVVKKGGECKACQPGWRGKAGTNKCERCEPGEYNEKNASSTCDFCPTGKFAVNQSSTACSDCTKGTFAPVVRLSQCVPCSSGAYQETNGQSSCKQCERGTFTSSLSQSECTSCLPSDPGRQTTVNQGAQSQNDCVCKKGYFHSCSGQECFISKANSSDHGFCSECPPGMICEGPEDSPQAMSRCGDGECLHAQPVCASGYFRDCEGVCGASTEKITDGFCTICPAGMVCEGPEDRPRMMITPTGAHKLPDVPAGYMAIGLQVYQCVGDGSNCPGATAYSDPDGKFDNMCANGGMDVACSICSQDYFFDGNSCVECGPRGVIGFSTLMVCIVVALLIMFNMSLPKEPMPTFGQETVKKLRYSSLISSMLKICLDMMQTVWIFATFSISLPAASGGESFGEVFDLSGFRLDCVGVLDPRAYAVTKTAWLNVGPLLVFAVLSMYLVLGKVLAPMFNKCLGQRYPIWPFACATALGLYSTFFMTIAKTAIAVGFSTYAHPDGTTFSLQEYPFILGNDAEFAAVQISCIAGVIIWCAGGLAVVAWLLMQLPKATLTPQFRRITIPFVVRFVPHRPWWFLVTLLTPLLVTLAVPLFQDGQWQLVFAVMVLVCYLVLLVSFRPYYYNIVHYGDVFSTVGKIFILVTCLPYQSGTGAGEATVVVTSIVYFVDICLLIFCCYLAISFTAFGNELYPRLDLPMKNLGDRVFNFLPKSATGMEGLCDESERSAVCESEGQVKDEAFARILKQKMEEIVEAHNSCMSLTDKADHPSTAAEVEPKSVNDVDESGLMVV